MLWQILSFPPCKHHVFLSHCREDREGLVIPVANTLRALGIIPWLDQHDYPYGRASFHALRDGILECRHTVFLVTANLLAQPRGWANIELGWASLLQENLLIQGGTLQNVILPLVFVSQSNRRLPRSIWETLRDRAVFHKRGRPVTWARDQIARFLEREARRGNDMAELVEQDSHIRARLRERPGLIDRVCARHPALRPIETRSVK
ncbi:MAG: toll/interleukin-1 receptor domain-containing protein [Planctomycetes bacterium]|jgi:hypothetical protein|nr:toll/interleukin-1 receptor domain-containing protein [Planctomycetota bacterium]